MASTVNFAKWFWNEDIWLPPNVTWTDLEVSMSRGGVAVAKFSDLWLPIPAALIVIAIRYVFERYLTISKELTAVTSAGLDFF